MATVGQKVEEVRSMLGGSLSDELTVLDTDYVVGAGKITLRYRKPNVSPGATISVGLNTFYALEVSSDGATMTVKESADGGPEVAVPHGEVVRINPRHTTWSIFNAWNQEVNSLSAPENGLYGYMSFDSIPDWLNNVYPLPDTGDWVNSYPSRLLSVRYQIRGFDQWQAVKGYEYQPENRAVRVYGATPNAGFLRFVFGFPFLTATDLTSDTSTLGLSTLNDDIPGIGVAARLALADEGRRNQPYSQGDPRRAEEIPPGANVNVARMFAARKAQRITEEAGRLLRLFGYSQPIGVSGD